MFGIAIAIAITGHLCVARMIAVFGEDARAVPNAAGGSDKTRAMFVRFGVSPPRASHDVSSEGAAVAGRERVQPRNGSFLQDRVTSRRLAAEATGLKVGASKYWPTAELQIQPLPRSEPDSTPLLGVKASGLPIRIRLYIDADGAINDIRVLQADVLDIEAVERIKEAFKATAFVPGKRNGAAVASYMDIELDLNSLM